MDKSKLIKKLALFAAYAFFAGASAYFTATSFALNLLHKDGLGALIVVYVLVFIVAVMAGWCLTKFIEEMRKKRGASKATAIFSFLGFLIFWLVSFTTNVHFFFIDKHGKSILQQELTSAKEYIINNTKESNRKIEDDKQTDISVITAQVSNLTNEFHKEIQNTLKYQIGFGDACISLLNSIETYLLSSNEKYKDGNKYVIYDDVRDAGDRGTTQRSKISTLQDKYDIIIIDQLKTKLDVVAKFYDLQKDQNEILLALLKPIAVIEQQHYPKVDEDGSANAYFKCQRFQQSKVIDNMPQAFKDACVQYNENNKVVKINVYPSARMFDTTSVWEDMFKHRLPGGMPMIQWILVSLIFDIMAFLLFALAKLQ